MDLSKRRKPELLLICEELGIEVGKSQRKPQLIEAIEKCGALEDEISEAWEEIEKRAEKAEQNAAEERERQRAEKAEQNAAEERERQRADQKEAAERKEREEQRAHELKLKELDVQRDLARQSANNLSIDERHSGEARVKIRDLMPSYKVNDDMGLFLVIFERTCERSGLALESWPQQILTVLPGEATEIIARLTKDESEDYQKVKAALLRKYRLSAEAFRRRFREAARTPGESFQDFSYKLKANLIEWLKGEDAFGCQDKIVELICKEQFYGSLSEEMRLWIQDRSGEKGLERAAVLADEFATRRESEKTRVRPFTKFSKEENNSPFTTRKLEVGPMTRRRIIPERMKPQ